jgi:hypothetical protein
VARCRAVRLAADFGLAISAGRLTTPLTSGEHTEASITSAQGVSVNKNIAAQFRRPAALAAACGIAVAGLAAGAGPAALAEQAHAARTTTIRLVSIQVTAKMIPTAVLESDKDETGGGKVAGADGLVCLIPARKFGACVAAINLSKGALFFEGAPTKSGAAGKIVGGTGEYAGAAGTLVATNASATRTLLVIKLRKL